MKPKPLPVLCLLTISMLAVPKLVMAASTPAAAPLAPLAFLAGSCWTAPFPGGKVQDTHCFDWLAGGKQLRDRHVVQGGPQYYGGETLYYWDADASRIAYLYVDANGGHSRGYVEDGGDALRFPEDRYTGLDGERIDFVTEWRKTGPDGYHMLARQRVKGELRDALDLKFTRVSSTVDPAVKQSSATDAAASGVTTRVESLSDGTRAVVTDAVVRAPLSDVWAAFTTREGWRSWAVPVAWVDLRVGGLIESSYDPAAKQGDPANIQNRILAILPQRIFAFQAVGAPPGFAHADLLPQIHSVVEFEALAPDRTRVRLSGSGYRQGADFDALLAFFDRGNTWTMRQLVKRFESGPADWSKLAAPGATAPKAKTPAAK